MQIDILGCLWQEEPPSAASNVQAEGGGARASWAADENRDLAAGAIRQKRSRDGSGGCVQGA